MEKLYINYLNLQVARQCIQNDISYVYKELYYYFDCTIERMTNVKTNFRFCLLNVYFRTY